MTPPCASAQIITDGTRLRQILLNGLTNAVKYSSSIATGIVVTVAAGAGRVTFTVADDGRGLPEGVTQEQLFRDFNTVGSGNVGGAVDGGRENVRSTGLGLPICNRCVCCCCSRARARARSWFAPQVIAVFVRSAHEIPPFAWFDFDLIRSRAAFPPRSLATALGGTLTVTNRDDGVHGAFFRLSLPLELPGLRLGGASGGGSLSYAAIATPLAVAAPLGYHVLVVDDSATNRRVAERVLRGLGCTCTLAEDGDEVRVA